ncbi:hypothetical protein N7494_012483 [Penicillium frequentans]|uniref:Uncharacterized protein n=1 Tax=Penicillium frequentans TaxID=3151616 RepID=A0AAD6CMH0_9EURO|nr:hypothetical protein N7494_012483 [Penicillium glabrum]
MAANNDGNATRHQQWYDPDKEEVNPEISDLLEKYSNIPSTKVVKHVDEIDIHDLRHNLISGRFQRARDFAANPYPCIGHYRFLNLTLLTHLHYQIIFAKLKSNTSAIYIDIGCCFGQDLRQLVHDGIPSSQLIGLDIEGSLMDLGYELFCDRETLESKFMVAEIYLKASLRASRARGWLLLGWT